MRYFPKTIRLHPDRLPPVKRTVVAEKPAVTNAHVRHRSCALPYPLLSRGKTCFRPHQILISSTRLKNEWISHETLTTHNTRRKTRRGEIRTKERKHVCTVRRVHVRAWHGEMAWIRKNEGEQQRLSGSGEKIFEGASGMSVLLWLKISVWLVKSCLAVKHVFLRPECAKIYVTILYIQSITASGATCRNRPKIWELDVCDSICWLSVG